MPGVFGTTPITTSSRINSHDAPGGCVLIEISWLVPSIMDAQAPRLDVDTITARILYRRFIPSFPNCISLMKGNYKMHSEAGNMFCSHAVCGFGMGIRHRSGGYRLMKAGPISRGW